jgi:hypothetical protein
MSKRANAKRPVAPAARVFSSLQADDVLLPGQASALRRSGAIILALMVLGATPFFMAANAVGLIGDIPAAVAHGGNSGPGGGHDHDDSSGPGAGDDDDDDDQEMRTDETSLRGHSTVGTTNDNDTHTRMGTDETSANGHSTRGTTNDNDTRTATGDHTRAQDQEDTGQTQTQTRD